MLKSTLEAFSDNNGQARLAAITGTVELANLIPPTVTYESRGDLLIVGPQETITPLAAQFAELHSVTLLATEKTSEATEENLYFSDEIHVKGYLGAFEVTCRVSVAGLEPTTNLAKIALGRDSFDLIVDLTENGVMSYEIPAPGYYAIGARKDKLARVIEELPDMLGTFDKPKYFRFNPDLCAHASRGVEGCDRCLDACPAGAISANADQEIEINPYLCQGVGTCATACPTEAITYALPDADDTQHFVHRLLTRYANEGGVKPTLLFYGNRDEANVVNALAHLPTSVIPVALEELATVGVDTWFSALFYGAHQVLLATNTAYIPATIDRVLSDELTTAQMFLTEMGYEADRICLFNFADVENYVPFSEALLPAGEQLSGNKRQKLFTTLEALYAQAPTKPEHSTVIEKAPYGSISCQADDCTLCMGCVAVCPTRALRAIGDRPGLLFIEEDCIQCGMCQKACPENVITAEPGFNWDWQARKEAKLVHEEPAACCINCGKPFAPESMVKMLIEKLQGHSHFQGDAIRRLSMCEDCRVRDIFSKFEDDPEDQIRV
ncbi:4Fe-4S binding protein [Photobacterium damselae]|nr:4Fe-4S binding protein [Photobacterium damselae]